MSCCKNTAWKSLVSMGMADQLVASGKMATPASQAPPATTSSIDTIFINGNFLLAVPSVDGESVTAVAVSGATIVDVGDSTRILGKKTAETNIVDLGGNTLAPGFVEAHGHIISSLATIYSTDVSVTNCPTYDSVIATISTAISGAKSGDWLFFSNYDPSLLTYGKDGFPQLGFAELDPITGTSGVNIFVENASGHIAYGNTNAFTTAGVTVHSNPGGGGHYGKVGGKLNGIMFEPPSFAPFMQFLPKEKIAAGAMGAMLGLLASAQQVGVTTFADPAVGIGGNLTQELEMYNMLASDPQAKTWVVGSIDATSLYSPTASTLVIKPVGLNYPRQPGATGSYKNLVIPNVKIWADGSTQGYTAYLTQPYYTTPTPPGLPDVGIPDWSQSDMNDLVNQAKADNWGVLIHGNGDAGIDIALTAIQNAYGAKSAFRNRIEHCTVARDDQYDTMQNLGVSPTYLNNHIAIWGDTFYNYILGADRANALDAAGSALSRQMIFSFHCDYATSTPNPLRYMQTAVLRQTASGRTLGSEYAIPAMEALKGVTIYPAMQLGIADRIGTIEAGKDADFVELAQDPTTVPPDTIASIAVLGTWLKGRSIPIGKPMTAEL